MSGAEYEALVETVMRSLTARDGVSSVERDVQLDGPDGPRQIDVLVRSKAGPFDLITIIECKDTGRVVPVTVVDGLASKMQDVRASKAAIVARRGFSKGARRKAERLGIDLFLADELSNVVDLPFELPVHVASYRFADFGIEGTMHLVEGTTLDMKDLLTLNGRDLVTEARAHVVSLSSVDLEGAPLTWQPEPPDGGWKFPTSIGDAPFEELRFSFNLVHSHRFGYLSDLPSVLYLRDELAASHRFLIPAEAVTNGSILDFPSYDSPEEFPTKPVVTVAVLELGDPGSIQFHHRLVKRDG